MSIRSMTTIRDDTLTLWRRLRIRGKSYTAAVFVTPDGVAWVKPDCRDYTLMVMRHGQHEIGRYNSRVAFDDLLDDITHAARQVGWVDA